MSGRRGRRPLQEHFCTPNFIHSFCGQLTSCPVDKLPSKFAPQRLCKSFGNRTVGLWIKKC